MSRKALEADISKCKQLISSAMIDAADRGEKLVVQMSKLDLAETTIVSAIDKYTTNEAIRSIGTYDCILTALALLADLYKLRGQTSQVKATHLRALAFAQELLHYEQDMADATASHRKAKATVKAKLPRQRAAPSVAAVDLSVHRGSSQTRGKPKRSKR